jgi:hypothetical protein
MAIYTVHARVARGDTTPREPEKFVFVRDGFHVWAMLLSLPWLVWHRLWWATLGYLVVSIALDVALVALGVGSGAIVIVMALLALLMGFEAATLRRWTLSRGRWRQVGMVAAADAEAAERRFFARWAGRRDLETDPVSIDRGAPPPPRPADPHGAAARPVLGLFPDPGLSR